MGILAILASFAGVLMGLSSIPQIFKIYKRKSASDVSKTSHFIIVTGALIWVLYGIEINSIPLILSNFIGLTTNLIILFECYYFSKI